MKNLVLKISLAFVAAFIFIGGVAFVNAQNATDTPATDNDTAITRDNAGSQYQNWRGYGMMGNRFGLDNYENGWDRGQGMMNTSFPGFVAGLLGLGIMVSIIVLLLVAFWVWMLVHAIRHDIEYKPVWILVLWFMNIIGAIIYYFAVKRQCPCCADWDGCYCGGDGCACKDDVQEEVVIVEEKKEE